MDIDSIRGLKFEIAQAIVEPSESAAAHKFGIEMSPKKQENAEKRGIALGVAQGSGRKDYRLAVRLQRRALEQDPALAEKLHSAARGEVEIRYIGQVFKQEAPWHQQRQRPLLIGSSIGHFRITAGTLGAFAIHRKTNRLVILSNNHVLANEDRGKAGEPVLQPGAFDGGKSSDRFGSLLDFVRFKPTANLIDAAIASIDEAIMFDPAVLTGIGRLAGLRAAPVEPGDVVHKVGRTTGVTRGIVTAVEMDDVAVQYDAGVLTFDRQIEIEGAGSGPFSKGGDSGSLIVDEDFRGCGLLFAGGDTGGRNGMGLTYANDLHVVLDQLNLSLAS